MSAAQQQRLEQLSLQALSDLYQDVRTVFVRRLKRDAYRGYDIVINDDGRREGTRVHITGCGPKNLTGYIVGADGTPYTNRTFRCHPLLAEVVPPIEHKAKPAIGPAALLGVGRDAPATPGVF